MTISAFNFVVLAVPAFLAVSGLVVTGASVLVIRAGRSKSSSVTLGAEQARQRS
jgi:hypothetical protein